MTCSFAQIVAVTIRRAVGLLSVLTLSACSGAQDRRQWPAEFVVYDEATGLRHFERSNGTHELVYQIREA